MILLKPSPLEKVPRNEADEVSWHKLTKSLSSRRGGRECGRRGVRGISLTKSRPSEGGGPLAVVGVAAQTITMFYGKNIETALRAISLTLVPRELPPGRSLLVSLSRAEKNADGCIAMRRFTPYSSTASGPPSLAREGSRKSRFLAIAGCAAITDTTSDDRWSPLQSKKMTDGTMKLHQTCRGASRSAPTDKIEILTLTTDQTKNSMSLFTIKTKRNPW